MAEGEATFSSTLDETPCDLDLSVYAELSDIIFSDDYSCPSPLEGPIEEHIKEIYKSSRRPEIGTVRERAQAPSNMRLTPASSVAPFSPLLSRRNQRTGRNSPSITPARQSFLFIATYANFLLTSARTVEFADSLANYYKVARKRFVDSVCQQVVNHFLLDDKESPSKS